MKINQFFEVFDKNNINDSNSNSILNVTLEKKNGNIIIRHKRKRKKLNVNNSQNLIDNENVPVINQNESITDYETSLNSSLESTNSTNNDSSINNSSLNEIFNNEITKYGPDTILTCQQIEKIEKEIKETKRKRINHNEAKHSQRYNNKKKLRNIFRKIGETLYKETSKIGLECIPIMVKKSSNIKEFKVYYRKETFEEYMKNTKKCTEEEAMKFLLGKEEGLVTNKGYHSLTKQMRTKFPSPTLYAVQKAKRYLRSKIFKVYRNPNGQYVDAEEKIKYFIHKNFDVIKNNIQDDTIRIKLCGDGFRKDGKSFFNFCFTLPDEGSIAKTSRGNYILGLFEIDKEDHTNLSLCLKNISENLELFNAKGNMDINGINYKIKFLLGGDMKFLRAAMGLNACNASHGCLWCTEVTSNYYKNNKNEFNSKQRCIDDFQQQKNGCINERIFKFISFDDVVFDTLHLLLRITEQLLSVVYLQLRTLDNNTSDLKLMTNQKKLFDHLTKIGIDKPYVIEVVDNYQKIKLRSFNGDECLKVLKLIQFDQIEPSFDGNENYQKIFNDFHDIFIKIKTNFYKDNSKELESDTDEWLKAFQYSFHSRHVTPYMHLFAGHLCFFVEKHGDVDIFNVQGLEKLNSLTKQYHRKTNNKNILYQMFEKRNIAEQFIFKKTAVLNLEKRQYSREKRKLHDEIIEKEETQEWVQYVVGDQRIFHDEIDQMNKGIFSWNVLELIFKSFETEKTLYLNFENTIKFREDPNFSQSINNEFKIIIGMHSHISLLVIFREHKKVFCIEGNERNAMKEKLYLKKCKNLSINNSSSNKNDWKIGKLEIKTKKINNELSKNVILGFGLLICLEAIVNSKTECTISLETIREKKKYIFRFFENLKKNYNDYCSSCGDSTKNDIDNLIVCQCRRNFHKFCLNENYLKKKIYKYVTFKCFFCRKKVH